MVISPTNGCSNVKDMLVFLSNTVWMFHLFINSTSFKYYLRDTLREVVSKEEHLFNKHLLSSHHVARTGKTA